MSYQIEGAIVKVKDDTLAIVTVKPQVFQSTSELQKAMNAYRHVFPGMPIVLMSQDPQGKPTWYGRKNIVSLLAKVNLRSIPWRRYIIN
ncbi:hypothetical protein [Desulfosporosinus hippei]|uniref:Uncharacterized protein n=1 Tax=Desulfosporosinus hippei DSM 8344 TaxID=1121419 RepID=A0A1G8BWV7_9FIRM|nr:hypothetical protein [Desulfosporosinus hippei]SDH37707.1 hypothetical protein SAMN05443529_112142 [Desulfosporosinus hippei DSM 8344]